MLWSDGDEATIATGAIALAKRFQGRAVGLVVRPPAGEFMPTGDFGMALSQDYIEKMQADAAQRALRHRHAFEAAVAAAGLSAHPAPGEAGAEYLEQDGAASTVIGTVGRVFDLLVIAKPQPKRSAETEILFETALFETGRPVLMLPEGVAAPKPGGVVAIAWNGSEETARTIALGLPLLAGADRVVVMEADGFGVPGPTAEDVAEYLSAHGFATQVRHLTGISAAEDAGAAFLREAATIGADLMIKGAYTQSRIRQLIFGGATRHILTNAGLPVLFAH
ncbi:MAG: universal stress protein [Alphaproteobacteria bacterium]|nr:MAG: universal stress protein [Alphaproteobacteria bacterium]